MKDVPMTAFQMIGDAVENPHLLRMKFRPADREPGSWRAELGLVARAIANSAQRPIWIAMSGGVESEITARAFLEQGVSFSAITLEHTEGTNRQEVEGARAWCYKRGIPHKIVPLNATRFLTHDVDTYIAAGYSTTRVYRYLQLRLLEIIDELGGYAVLGNGKINFHPEDDAHGVLRATAPINSGYAVPYIWCEQHSATHQPFFLLGSSEAVLSYLESPFIKLAIDKPIVFGSHKSNAALRRIVYLTEWPEVVSRASFRGFENLKELCAGAERRMKQALPDNRVLTKLTAEQIVAQLRERL